MIVRAIVPQVQSFWPGSLALLIESAAGGNEMRDVCGVAGHYIWLILRPW